MQCIFIILNSIFRHRYKIAGPKNSALDSEYIIDSDTALEMLYVYICMYM